MSIGTITVKVVRAGQDEADKLAQVNVNKRKPVSAKKLKKKKEGSGSGADELAGLSKVTGSFDVKLWIPDGADDKALTKPDNLKIGL